MKKKTSLLPALALGLFLAGFPGGQCVPAESSQESQTSFDIPAGAYASLEELEHKRIGVMSGTYFDKKVADHFPEAEAVYYNTTSDLLAALRSGKIDTFAMDEPVMIYVMEVEKDITFVPAYLDTFEYAYAFPKTEKGRKICGEMSEFIRKLRDEDVLEEKIRKWCSRDEADWVMPDYENFPAPNGTLVMATDATLAPFTFMYGSKPVGYDIDIAAEFCEAYGYGLELVNMNVDGVLPAVQSGKCDFIGLGLSITKERAESVLFTEPNYTGGIVMAVLAEGQESASGGLVESFKKTFIREERWKLFLLGVTNTLIITIASILLGTALGFLVFLLCRNGNRLANGITNFCLWLVRGMPMVVMLMIFYYIIFGKLSISGIIVAIIGFTLTFGASVFGQLKTGTGAVDPGQYEAAYALGYSNRQTFFKIILPQALPHVVPSYNGEITSLIKATAIVGYIAVQDLTKMGDLVRSRTYEAFFPLIAVAVIYFLLEYLLGFAAKLCERGIDIDRDKREDVLKGVNTDDPN